MEYMESMESQPGSQHMVLEQEALSGEVSVSGSVWAGKDANIWTLIGRFVRVKSTPKCKQYVQSSWFFRCQATVGSQRALHARCERIIYSIKTNRAFSTRAFREIFWGEVLGS